MASPSAGLSLLPLEFQGGERVSIAVPVTLEAGSPVQALVRLKVYEGSALPGRGRLLDSQEQNAGFEPGQTQEIAFVHETVSTSQGRRDVGVEVLVEGEAQASQEFDDVFQVKSSGFGDIFQVLPGLLVVMAVSSAMNFVQGEDA